MALVKHFETDTWAYWSSEPKYTPNTYITKDVRKLYVGGPGPKATAKIAPPNADGIAAGTLLTFDMEEYNQELGYHRLLWFKDLETSTLVPAWITDYFEELLPSEPEKWELWMDHSGVAVWTDPIPEPPDPEPEPPDPEPDPDPDPAKEIAAEFEILGWTVTVWRYL